MSAALRAVRLSGRRGWVRSRSGGGGAGEASRVGAHLRTAHSGHASKELGQAKATV